MNEQQRLVERYAKSLVAFGHCITLGRFQKSERCTFVDRAVLIFKNWMAFNRSLTLRTFVGIEPLGCDPFHPAEESTRKD